MTETNEQTPENLNQIPETTAVQKTESSVRNIKDINPLMQRFNAMPPETFRLPSGGVLYTNGELDEEVVNGEVLVLPMTTVDEITMKSPDMLFQGTAIEQVFKRCIPQVLKPMELLSNDVDYLLICLRIITYGHNLDIYWNCPACAKAKGDDENNDINPSEKLKFTERTSGEEVETELSRDEQAIKSATSNKEFANVKPTKTVDLNKFLKTSVPLKYNDNENFLIRLSSGENVQLRPSTFKEILNLYQYDTDKLESPEELTDFIVTSLMYTIHSVDGHKNREHIAEWLKHCKAPIIEELQEKLHVANDWGTGDKYDFVCDKCGHESSTSIPINPIHFFTSPLINETKV